MFDLKQKLNNCHCHVIKSPFIKVKYFIKIGDIISLRQDDVNLLTALKIFFNILLMMENFRALYDVGTLPSRKEVHIVVVALFETFYINLYRIILRPVKC